MNAIVYYLSLPFIYLISILPFWALYILSDAIYAILFYIIGYRKKIVYNNLKNAFPSKSEKEIKALRKRFYHFFCDLMLETLKTLTISAKTAQKHVIIEDKSVLEEYYQKKQSIIIVLGHMGNWELVGAGFAQVDLHEMYTIYHPLSNKYFDQLIYHMRTRLGNKLYAMNNTLKGMLRNKNKLNATVFIADQTPRPKGAYWTTFLNQDTPVFFGTEKIAKKLNYPVVYASIKRIERGKYSLNFELLVDNPKETQTGEISEIHTKRLEKDIIEQPEVWLWSHRRWKHKRP
jgi:KDO2-lipid IV(A) lauroyltransferase